VAGWVEDGDAGSCLDVDREASVAVAATELLASSTFGMAVHCLLLMVVKKMPEGRPALDMATESLILGRKRR
jgi:hypothetical protein